MDNILKAGIFKAPFFRPGFLDKANGYLAVFFLLLFVYLVADTVSFRPSAAVKKIISGPSNGKTSLTYPAGAPQQEETYNSSLFARQVFGKSTSAKSDNESETPLDIGLVGIIVGARPQALIENKGTRVVHYIYKGDKFEGCTAQDVTADKVVLSCDDEIIELHL